MLVVWEWVDAGLMGETDAGCVWGRRMLALWGEADAGCGEADASCVGVGGCLFHGGGGCLLCGRRWMLDLWGRRMLVIWK